MHRLQRERAEQPEAQQPQPSTNASDETGWHCLASLKPRLRLSPICARQIGTDDSGSTAPMGDWNLVQTVVDARSRQLLRGGRSMISPSCATDAMRVPSRRYIAPVISGRDAFAAGVCIVYSVQSSKGVL